MNKTIGLITLTLVLLTGLIIGQLSNVVRPSPNSQIAFAEHASETALAYYSALNELLTTGNPASVLAILHPRFTDHSSSGEPERSAQEFESLLVELASATPGTWVEASIVVAEGNLVGVQTNFRGTDTSLSDGIALEFGDSPGVFEMLRIEDDRIIERWSDVPMKPPVSVDVSASLDMPAPGKHLNMSLHRITLDPFTRLRFANDLGAVMLVESGAIELAIDPATTIPGATVETMAELGEGDAKVVRAGAPFLLINSGDQAASVLTATFDHSVFIQSQFDNPAELIEEKGVTRELLAQGPGVRALTDDCRITVSRIDLSPGTGVAQHTVQESEIALVMAGEIGVEIDQGKVRQTSPDGIVQLLGAPLELASGEAIAVTEGVALGYRANQSSTVSLMLISVAPVD